MVRIRLWQLGEVCYSGLLPRRRLAKELLLLIHENNNNINKNINLSTRHFSTFKSDLNSNFIQFSEPHCSFYFTNSEKVVQILFKLFMVFIIRIFYVFCYNKWNHVKSICKLGTEREALQARNVPSYKPLEHFGHFVIFPLRDSINNQIHLNSYSNRCENIKNVDFRKKVHSNKWKIILTVNDKQLEC